MLAFQPYLGLRSVFKPWFQNDTSEYSMNRIIGHPFLGAMECGEYFCDTNASLKMSGRTNALSAIPQASRRRRVSVRIFIRDRQAHHQDSMLGKGDSGLSRVLIVEPIRLPGHGEIGHWKQETAKGQSQKVSHHQADDQEKHTNNRGGRQ